MTASSLGQTSHRLAPNPGPFAPNHPWDRNFYLLYVGLAWLGILSGFVPEIVHHVAAREKPFPIIVHFHAVAFMGWLALFSAQVLLIRTRRWEVHRKLGFAMLGLAGIMMVLGPATALIADHGKIGTPDADPGFLSIQFTDIVAFVGLLSAAVVFRNTAPAHKRLVLMATIYITDAGFARWLGGPIGKIVGHSHFGMWASLYACTAALMLGIGLYDLITRKRLHPAYLAGLAWVAVIQFTSVTLYFTPAWKALAASWIAAA
ncbi:MAG: hypothetical protein ACXU8S_13965 [Phenylobacterium sp.]